MIGRTRRRATFRARKPGFDSVWLIAATFGLAACGDLASEPEQIPRTLEVLPADTVVTEGDQASFRVRLLDQNGVEIDHIPSWAGLRWTVTDSKAASTTQDGLVSAITAGSEVRVVAGLVGLSGGSRMRINPSNVLVTAEAVQLTQGAQNLEGEESGLKGTVTLVENRPSLLRLWLTGDQLFYTDFIGLRPRATFYVDGEEIHSARLSADHIPVEMEEGELDGSFNALIPGSAMRRGVEFAIEVDPDGVLPAAPGSDAMVPAAGRMTVDLTPVPRFPLTVVPVLTGSGDNAATRAWVNGLTAQSSKLHFTRQVLPISDELDVSVRQPFTTSEDLTTAGGWSALLRAVSLVWADEDATSYYYGALALPPGSAWGGLGWVGWPIGIGDINPETLAHELGHNHALSHAPCGGAGNPDPNFPHAEGRIGVHGYDRFAERILAPSVYDYMTYCNPAWASDFFFEKALRWRLEYEQRVFENNAETSDKRKTLVLWGETTGGKLELEPAFVLETSALLPRSPGPYRLDGRDANDRSLFSLSFTPMEIEFGGGGFIFALPYDDSWDGPDGLERVTLSGPSGEVALERSGGPIVTLVRDRASGRIRGILRGGGELPNWALGADLQISDGLPGGGSTRVRE